MSRGWRLTLAAGAAVGAVAWTLAALAAWGLLQAAAGALDGGSAATAMQAVTAWSERPWVQLWLDPHELAMLRDGVDGLLSFGGGPAAWLGSAVTLLTVGLVVIWAGGLVLAALAIGLAVLLVRRADVWWRGRTAGASGAGPAMHPG